MSNPNRDRHPNDDDGIVFQHGPVPDMIVQATGATNWSDVARWMDQQFNAAGTGPNFAGHLEITFGEGGEESVEVIPEQRIEPEVTPEGIE